MTKMGLTSTLQWSYIGLTAAFHWPYIGQTPALHWSYIGVISIKNSLQSGLYIGKTSAKHLSKIKMIFENPLVTSQSLDTHRQEWLE
jgi:hypothetical protein